MYRSVCICMSSVCVCVSVCSWASLRDGLCALYMLYLYVSVYSLRCLLRVYVWRTVLGRRTWVRWAADAEAADAPTAAGRCVSFEPAPSSAHLLVSSCCLPLSALARPLSRSLVALLLAGRADEPREPQPTTLPIELLCRQPLPHQHGQCDRRRRPPPLLPSSLLTSAAAAVAANRTQPKERVK